MRTDTNAFQQLKSAMHASPLNFTISGHIVREIWPGRCYREYAVRFGIEHDYRVYEKLNDEFTFMKTPA